ncbi:MAG: DUF6625 family protein, partial [Promethearchaeota archaeon]
KIINTSLNAIDNLITEKLGIQVNIKYPFKLCDFRPAYGLIFSDYIKNYDFWGYGDLDLIYGNIKYFITDQILADYDIISNHPDFITGHFCILKNKQFINELFKEGDYYKAAFMNKKYIGFDEQISFIHFNTNPRYLKFFQKANIAFHLLLVFIVKYLKRIFPRKIKITKRKIDARKLKDFTTIVKYFQRIKQIRVYFGNTSQSDLAFKKVGKKNWHIKWYEGHLRNIKETKELMYFHFIISKHKKTFFIEKMEPVFDSFYITKYGISNLSGGK